MVKTFHNFLNSHKMRGKAYNTIKKTKVLFRWTPFTEKKIQMRFNSFSKTDCPTFCWRQKWKRRNPIIQSFFLGDRREAYSHKATSKWFRFFSRPWLPYPSVFLLFKSNFLRPYRSDLFEFYINNTTGSRSSIFQIFGGQNFSPASCWRRQLKTKFFQKVSVILSHFFGLISHEWYLDAGYGMKNEPLNAFSF